MQERPWTWPTKFDFTEEQPAYTTTELPQVKTRHWGLWVSAAVMLLICTMLGAMIWSSTNWSSPALPQVTDPSSITRFPQAPPIMMTLPEGQATTPVAAVVHPLTAHASTPPRAVVPTSPAALPIKPASPKPPPTPTPVETTLPPVDNSPTNPVASPTAGN